MLATYELATLLTVATVLSMWARRDIVWKVVYAVTIIVALVTGSLELLALLSIAVFLGLVWGYNKANNNWWLYLIGIFVVGLAFGLHVVPGFNNHEYLEVFKLSDTSAELNIWFNYDKSLFGVVLLGVIFHKELIRSKKELTNFLKKLLPILVLGLPAVFLIGIAIGYASLDYTPAIAVFIPWALKNLFFTVIAEEMMFRGLIQRELINRIKSDYAAVIGIGVAGILFGVAHFAGGPGYVFLSTIAGCLYGYAYYATGRIEAAIATHLLLNACHFIFFSYPYLAA